MWTSTHACWNCRFPFLGKVAEPGQDTGGGGAHFLSMDQGGSICQIDLDAHWVG